MSEHTAVLKKLGIDPDSPAGALTALQTALMMRTLSEGSEADPGAAMALLEAREIDPHLHVADLPAFQLAGIYTLASQASAGGVTCVDFSGFNIGDTWPVGAAQFAIGGVFFEVDFDGGGGPDAARITDFPPGAGGDHYLEPVGQPVGGLRVELPSPVGTTMTIAFRNAGPEPAELIGYDQSHTVTDHIVISDPNVLASFHGGTLYVVITGVELLLREVCVQ